MTGIARLCSAESVTEGHPDKICDQIADAVLDEHLAQDPNARVACEVLAAKDLIVVAGEITSESSISIEDVVRRVLKEIGYTDESIGLNADTCQVLTSVSPQSLTVRDSVDVSVETKERRVRDKFDRLGAGDQAVVIGYACNDTEVLMPLPIVLANRLAQRLSKVRKDSTIPSLRPDGKTLVTVEYRDHDPVRVSCVLISAQHEPDTSQRELRALIYQHVIVPCIPPYLLDDRTQYLMNPSGPWSFGGPGADTGLSGRKLTVDTYGIGIRLGGGALSGKDPTKIDRLGALAARYVAKNIVAAGFADRLEVEIGYAIGLARPVYITTNTSGSERIPVPVIHRLIHEYFELRPAGVIELLNLRRPIYRQTAAYGHFGRSDIELPWEDTQEAIELRRMKLHEHEVLE